MKERRGALPGVGTDREEVVDARELMCRSRHDSREGGARAVEAEKARRRHWEARRRQIGDEGGRRAHAQSGGRVARIRRLAAGGATRGRRREQAEEGVDGVTTIMGEELGGVLRDGGAWSAWSGREPASDDGLGRCRAPCLDIDPGQGRRDDAPWGAGEPRGLGSATRSRAPLRRPARRTMRTEEKVGRRPCGLGRRRAVWVWEKVGRWPGMVAAPWR